MAEHKYLDQGNSEVQDKQAEAYLYASSGTTGIAATGVIEGLLVTQTGTASGSVLIDAGACLNQASLGQGADRLINPSQKTLDIFTADPMGGLPRNDIIAFDSITTAIIMIKGVATATPDDPTVPATSVALAKLRHAASATTIPTAKIDSLIVPTMLRLGEHVHKDAATGGALPYTASGSNVAAPGTGGNTVINFGVTFTTAVWPVACSGSGVMIVEVTAINNVGFNVKLYDAAGVLITTGSRRVNWSATGVLA